MPVDRDAFRSAVEHTEVVRPPKQQLATFGVTCIDYYLVTEPTYAEVTGDTDETVVRTGSVIAERPKIVTPFYLMNLFQGFDHGQDFAQYLASTFGPQAPGLMYSYRNELRDTSIVSDSPRVVTGRLIDQLDREDNRLSAVIRGVDHLWDVSLMKFIHDLTVGSLGQNVREMQQHGLFEPSGGVPRAAHERVRELFAAVRAGEASPHQLKTELDRWGLFGEYEDRFLDLFRRR
jgi:hypothetical protein